MQEPTAKKIKVVFLGDRSVGKSSIITRFISNQFDENVQPTVGVDFLGKNVQFKGVHYRIELWDTAGQQKYRSLVKGYLKGADACVFVYDCSQQVSFQNLKQWAKMFENAAGSNAFRIVVANKCDKIEHLSKGKINTIDQNQPQIAGLTEIVTSALNGVNVQVIFEKILENVKEKQRQASNQEKGIISALKSAVPSKTDCCK